MGRNGSGMIRSSLVLIDTGKDLDLAGREPNGELLK
jgi:hypothetical protein